MSEPTDVADEILGRPWTVYFYYGTNDELLYVGVTGNGPERGKEHSRFAVWWARVVRAEYEHHHFEADARAAEAQAIMELQPIYNIAGKEPATARTAQGDHPPEGGGVPEGHASGSYPISGNTTSTEIGADGISRLWDGYANDRDASLRRRWGLKLEQWEAIRNAGDPHGGCAGCGRRNVRLVVDDDHDTGELCGTLCDACNRKITERLRRYILNPPSRTVADRLGIPGFFLPTSRQEAYEKGRERRREYQRKWFEQRVKRNTGRTPPPRSTDTDYHAKVEAALAATKRS